MLRNRKLGERDAIVSRVELSCHGNACSVVHTTYLKEEIYVKR